MTTVLRRALVPVPRRPLTILLAERQIESREALARDLEADGALVDAVSDGEAAIQRLTTERFRPDVIISGSRLPHRNGVELLAWVRSVGLEIPFILLATDAEGVDVPAVAAYRRALVVARPLRKGELGEALRSLMAPWRSDEMGSMEAP